MSTAVSSPRVVPVPCLADNYAYLVQCPATGATAAVDPSEPGPVIAALETLGVRRPDALWCTHHHWDHVGGVAALRAHYGADVPVYGHASEHARIPELSRPLDHAGTFTLGGLLVRALHVPGHTLGAVAFCVGADAAVFTGDTLFVAGCGRLFEGTAAMMFASLVDTLGALPGATRVYPGHEYAEKNLRFAASVEPANAAVRARYAAVCARRAAGEACVPSTLGEERATNPFLRTTEEAVRAFARGRGSSDPDPIAVLAAVRAARDTY